MSGHRAADGQPPLYVANVQAEVLAVSEEDARIMREERVISPCGASKNCSEPVALERATLATEDSTGKKSIILSGRRSVLDRGETG